MIHPLIMQSGYCTKRSRYVEASDTDAHQIYYSLSMSPFDDPRFLLVIGDGDTVALSRLRQLYAYVLYHL